MPKTLEEVFDAVLDVKSDVVDLKEHVNHRSTAMEQTIQLLGAKLDTKADKTELLFSVVFKQLQKPLLRWTLGVGVAGVLATLGYTNWAPFLLELFK